VRLAGLRRRNPAVEYAGAALIRATCQSLGARPTRMVPSKHVLLMGAPSQLVVPGIAGLV